MQWIIISSLHLYSVRLKHRDVVWDGETAASSSFSSADKQPPHGRKLCLYCHCFHCVCVWRSASSPFWSKLMSVTFLRRRYSISPNPLNSFTSSGLRSEVRGLKAINQQVEPAAPLLTLKWGSPVVDMTWLQWIQSQLLSVPPMVGLAPYHGKHWFKMCWETFFNLIFFKTAGTK